MSPTRPSLDTVFELLAERRRRFVLYCLAEAGENRVLTLDDVVDQVTEWEREWNADRGSDSPDRRERVRIDLHHDHIPRLADAGLVDYDARTGTIRNWDAPSLDRWVPAESEELPHLRALFGVGDVMDAENDSEDEDSERKDSADGESADGDAR